MLLTRPPLDPQIVTPKGSDKFHALDLHVLGTPPAFVLSQDQTLKIEQTDCHLRTSNPAGVALESAVFQEGCYPSIIYRSFDS